MVHSTGGSRPPCPRKANPLDGASAGTTTSVGLYERRKALNSRTNRHTSLAARPRDANVGGNHFNNVVASGEARQADLRPTSSPRGRRKAGLRKQLTTKTRALSRGSNEEKTAAGQTTWTTTSLRISIAETLMNNREQLSAVWTSERAQANRST